MKTRKHNLNAIAVGVALAMGSLPVLAAAPANPAAAGAAAIIAAEKAAKAPTFNAAEQTGLCLIDSVVSLLAARTNDFGCAKKVYDLSVFTTDNAGEGQAEIGGGADGGGTTLEASLSPSTSIGTKCTVRPAAGVHLLSGVPVKAVAGNHGWSRTSEIFNSDLSIELIDPQTKGVNKYKEINIKDYFKKVEGTGELAKAWEYDWGLEDIKKHRSVPAPGFYYPVQKWMDLSWYSHENGGEGYLKVQKTKIIPRSASACKIQVEVPEGGMFNGSGEFEADGTVTVGPALF